MSNKMSKFVCQQLDELEELFKKKHEQYSAGVDELANFRCGALLNGRSDDAEGMFEELKAYAAKHITPANIKATGEFADKAVDKLIEKILKASKAMKE